MKTAKLDDVEDDQDEVESDGEDGIEDSTTPPLYNQTTSTAHTHTPAYKTTTHTQTNSTHTSTTTTSPYIWKGSMPAPQATERTETRPVLGTPPRQQVSRVALAWKARFHWVLQLFRSAQSRTLPNNQGGDFFALDNVIVDEDDFDFNNIWDFFVYFHAEDGIIESKDG